jgi:uncharacterized protein YndB with AHSA1/START domain
MTKSITVETTVNKDIDTVWEFWTKPEHVVKWNNASLDWECPKATNDLSVGGKFSYTMAAKDGSVSFDFSCTYTEVVENKSIKYTMDDGRKVSVSFDKVEGGVHITETFEPENENPEEMQREGWQAILNNFKQVAEQ